MPGIGATLLFGKGNAKAIAAEKKRNIRAQKQQAIQPYNDLKRSIDNFLVELDFLKTKTSAWIEENK